MKNELLDEKNENEKLYYSMSKEMIEKYDLVRTKENVEKLISEYKTAKFQYLASEQKLKNISMCYEPKYNQFTEHVSDKIGDNVGKLVDSKNVIEYFDSVFNPLFTMMSEQERKYYSICLINNNSEQIVADILGISRTGLIPIKQNCIIKIALAFHIAIMK